MSGSYVDQNAIAANMSGIAPCANAICLATEPLLLKKTAFASGKMAIWLMSVLLMALVLGVYRPASAQLATSFVTITGIKVKRLPNAVVVRIETDGTVRFGGDLRDFVSFEDGFDPRPTQSVRLRVVQARAKLPAYVPIDAYPLDGAAISLGRSTFQNPFFSRGGYGQAQPLVDIELRFAAPVKIRRFSVEPYNSIDFGNILGPREASIELAPNRRAIVITIIPDRADLTATQRLNRSPESGRKHTLSVRSLEDGAFRVAALHTPLRELLDTLARATGTVFVARPEVADVDVSLFLPRATPAQFLDTLERAANLGAREENGSLVLGRGDEFFAARSLPLFNLSPDAARLLFPDFLLPFLRADPQNNALLATQTPGVLDKIAEQLRRIDTPRAQFEVSAQFWELTQTRVDDSALQILRSIGGDRQSLNAETGDAVIQISGGQTQQLSATLQLLTSQGRAKLMGNPRVSVLSGAKGTLFSGQTRYVQVVQDNGYGQSAVALPLSIGTTLEVSPRGSNSRGDPIRLDIAPRLSTVDAIESGTGLPTLGLRELSGTLVVGEGESIAFAGLESDIDSRTKRKVLRLFPSRIGDREKRSLLVLISARRLTWTEPGVAQNGGAKKRWVALNPSVPGA